MGTTVSKAELQIRKGFTYSDQVSYLMEQQSIKPASTNSNSKNSTQTSFLARPIGGDLPKAQPIPAQNLNDSRQQFSNNTGWPNSVHGLVLIDTGCPGLLYWGTGVLIGFNCVLTAASNVYDLENKCDYQSIFFIPQFNGTTAPYGVIKAKRTYCPSAYKRGNETEDYALLALDQSIGSNTGYFGFRVTDPTSLEGKEVTIMGYPEDKVQEENYELWGMSGPVQRSDSGFAPYDSIKTDRGQNGSGIFYQENDNYFVAGVHLDSKSPVWITQDRYQHIIGWIVKAYLVNSTYTDSQNITEFYYNDIEDVELKVLAAQNFPNLREVTLRKDLIGIGSTGAQILASNTTWINLSMLDLSYNAIGNTGSAKLAANSIWSNLKVLKLNHNAIGSQGLASLAANNSWTNLEELYLRGNAINRTGAGKLACNKSWVRLSVLDLTYNSLGDRSMEKLAANESWVNLSVLALSDNFIKKKGVDALTTNKSWVKLTSLDLSYNEVDREGAAKLRRAFSNLKDLLFM